MGVPAGGYGCAGLDLFELIKVAPFMSGGYDWSIARVSPLTAETMLNRRDHHMAPAGQSYYVATARSKRY